MSSDPSKVKTTVSRTRSVAGARRKMARSAALRVASRSLAPLALLLTDEGVNGLDAHVVNDGPHRVEGRIRARLFRDAAIVGEGERAIEVAGHAQLLVHVDALFPGFVDTTYAYRFGPAGHELVHVELLDDEGTVLASAYHLPLGLVRAVESDLGLEASFEDEHRRIRLRARRLALFCALDLDGVTSDDDFFHLAPGEERVIALRPDGSGARVRGTVHPVNQRSATRIG